MTVLDWVLDADPSIRWQALRDLVDAPAEVVAAERARVASEGWGARLLALQGEDGQWDGGALFPARSRHSGDGGQSEGQPWTATLFVRDHDARAGRAAGGGWTKRFKCSDQSSSPMARGCWRTLIPARSTSRSRRAMVGLAGGTRYGRCVFSAGTGGQLADARYPR